MTPPSGDLHAVLARLVRDVPDFPKPGILFKDICPLLADPAGFAAVVEGLSAFGRDEHGAVAVDKVAGIEARGFVLAAPVAVELGVGFVPVRKAGSLPGPTYQQSYALEYGVSTLEIQRDAFRAGDRVLVVDDVLATGGTLKTAAALVHRADAVVSSVCVLIELGFLSGGPAVRDLGLHALLTV